MKPLITILFLSISLLLSAQDITNTLGASGTFKVKNSSSQDIATISNNGNTNIGGSLTVNSNSDAYTLPTVDGSANQVIKTDGSGNLETVKYFV